MRKIVITMILAVATLHGYAQNAAGNFLPRANDEVKRQQVAYVAANEGAENTVWDFTQLECSGREYPACYAEEEAYEGLIVGTEFNTRHYYQASTDSLLLRGYENNLTKVSYDRPELLLHLPLTYGERKETLFHGTACYCERLFLRLFGTTSVEVDATGSMLLPSGDTLRHVSRVHIQKLKAEQQYPQLTTGQELKAYVDSLTFTGDSIRQRMQDGRQLMQTDTYRWYAAGYRYPIVESIATGPAGMEPQLAVTLYCPPEEQCTLYDEDNELLRQLLAEADRHAAGGSNDGDGGNAPSPLSRCAVGVNGGTVTIDYDLTQPATISALVCNTQGMLFLQQSQTSEAGTGHQLTLDCHALRHGEYILYLSVNGQVTSQKVSL